MFYCRMELVSVRLRLHSSAVARFTVGTEDLMMVESRYAHCSILAVHSAWITMMKKTCLHVSCLSVGVGFNERALRVQAKELASMC